MPSMDSSLPPSLQPAVVSQAGFLHAALTAIESRFPLLRLLRLSPKLEDALVPLPAVAGLGASILDTTNEPCCVVVPDRREMALAVGLLTAISRLAREVPEILRIHANKSFDVPSKEEPKLVLVHPSGYVYEYAGFFTSEFFRLKVLGRNEWRSLPVKEVARLEETLKKRPKGYLNSDLGQPQPTVLGVLVGIQGKVNRNFLRTYVVVLGTKKPLKECLATWRISVEGHTLTGILGDEVPCGELGGEGKLTFLDKYVASGEPLIATASSADDVATFCKKRDPYSVAVIADDAERLARNLQAFDNIVAGQRLLIVADTAQHEAVRALQQRGCLVWHLQAEEILLGCQPGADAGPLNALLTKASNMQDLVVAASACECCTLEKAAGELISAARAIPPNNGNPAVRELLACLFGILRLCAEHLGFASGLFCDLIGKRLSDARALAKRATSWLDREVAVQVETGITGLESAAQELSPNLLTPKGKVLLEYLASAGKSPNSAAIVTGSAAHCDVVCQWLADQGLQVPVYPVNRVPDEGQFEQLVIVSWPGSRRFDRLIRLYAAKRLQVLTYSFERRWLDEYSQHYSHSVLPSLSATQKFALLGLDKADNETAIHPPPPPPHPFDLPEERFLTPRKVVRAEDADPGDDIVQSVEAHYMDFAGSTFAYITDGHELPVVNDYVSEERSIAGKVPFRSIEELKIGDFVLFRATGDSDIIRFMVEDEIGSETYRKLRATATSWKRALRQIGSDPQEIWEKLRKFGFQRQPETVRAWLCKSDMIAPKCPDDIRTIARASGDMELLDHLPLVEEAISEINGHHIRAGKRLTSELLKELPGRLDLSEGKETEVDLIFGKVWIVRIEEIDEELTHVKYTVANRLLRDAEYLVWAMTN